MPLSRGPPGLLPPPPLATPPLPGPAPACFFAAEVSLNAAVVTTAAAPAVPPPPAPSPARGSGRMPAVCPAASLSPGPGTCAWPPWPPCCPGPNAACGTFWRVHIGTATGVSMNPRLPPSCEMPDQPSWILRCPGDSPAPPAPSGRCPGAGSGLGPKPAACVWLGCTDPCPGLGVMPCACPGLGPPVADLVLGFPDTLGFFIV